MSVEEEEKAKYIFGLKPEETVVKSHATRRAEGQCGYMLPVLDEMVKERGAVRILDVGCGPGSITIDLAKRVRDGGGEVVGVDFSGAVLETARVNAEKEGVRNVRFLKGDVYDLVGIVGEGGFDVVYTHQAVAHFHDHVKAIHELIRVCKKGSGALCMREGDLRTARFFPDENGLLAECFQAIIKVHQANGGASDAGRQLKAWTVQAGIPRERLKATHSAWSYNTPEERREYGAHWPARCTQGAFAERAVELGVKRERLEEYALAWKRWMNHPGGLFAMMHGEVIAWV